MTSLIAAAAAIGAVWILQHYSGPAGIYLGVGIACVGLLPFFFIELIFPPVFDMTCTKKSVDYDFRNDMYAMEFEMLNRHDNNQDPEGNDAAP